MRFKHPDLEKEFNSRSDLLKQMARDFERVSFLYESVEPTVTRVLEKVDGSSGVHEVGRAIDFRDETRANGHSFFVYTEWVRNQILAYMNERYRRTDGKQTLIWHSFQGAPHHFHLQCAASKEVYVELSKLLEEQT